jgi:dTDP-4-amino-4,6-dideoxygalactose transaminase
MPMGKPVNSPLQLMRPVLPDAEALLPFLKRIDESRHYTNFGPLQEELAQKLLELQPRFRQASIHAVCTSSATLGLELALSALDLPKGSRIGLPALTFVATASAITRCGHVPVVLDIDEHDWMLNSDDLADFPASLAAVVPVATFGMPQDAQMWSRWSDSNGIPVIIDAAGAIGAQATASGVTVVFSLHATKPLSAAEGGLIITEDAELAERLRSMTNFGIGLNDPAAGTNAKLSEYHAAVGLAALKDWPKSSHARMKLYRTYVEQFSHRCNELVTFQQDSGQVAPCIFAVRMATGALRDAVERRCMIDGIGTRRWYLPLIQNQPMLSNVELPAQTPNALRLEQTLLGLPFSLDMQDEDVARVVQVIESEIFLAQANSKFAD